MYRINLTITKARTSVSSIEVITHSYHQSFEAQVNLLRHKCIVNGKALNKTVKCIDGPSVSFKVLSFQ